MPYELYNSKEEEMFLLMRKIMAVYSEKEHA